ncbi:MAG: LL-diaminopimelate aminotransferase [Deltaproteobacteria bacterium]|nr:LL-diaminopimelate aminotransferase [Deltaproteobacteria bacterium]
MKDEVKARGVDIIDLGVGDPDLPTPQFIIKRLQEAAQDPSTHRYPSYSGMDDFRVAVARWYRHRFGVELDPKREVVTLIGSKEGLAHMPLAFNNPGDLNLVTSPAYPVYHIGTLFAGAQSYFLPLLKENQFLPDLSQIPPDIARRAKMLFFNYPNNPTAAVADKNFFAQVVDFCRQFQIIAVHDAAYTEVAYDGFRPPSFLEVPGAKEIGIEFHSLSKTYNMTGWRLGFAVGNAQLVEGLGLVKSNIDSGVFNAIQWAGITALNSDQALVAERESCRIYQERRDILVKGLQKLGYEVDLPKATFYVWLPVPRGLTSAQFTAHLLDHAGIVTTPGNGFGAPGEGYVRLALTVDKARIEEALVRLARLG